MKQEGESQMEEKERKKTSTNSQTKDHAMENALKYLNKYFQKVCIQITNKHKNVLNVTRKIQIKTAMR